MAQPSPSPPRDDWQTQFADPPRSYGAMPFWFWNDDLEEAELLRQINIMHQQGFGGFVPQARIGLSRRVGYLTPTFFQLMRSAVAEAARLGMQVVLYDEGSYPSGSAQGRVVAERPEYASRCLIGLHTRVQGPRRGYWHPNPGRALGDRLVAAVLGRVLPDGSLDPETLRVLPSLPPELIPYEVGAGEWQITAIWDVASGGTIRGVFDDEDDQHVGAPAASDLLNPDAVASFIHHTHERYYEELAPYFGSTIIAMFTDEPMLLGRSPKRGPQPWPISAGLLDEVRALWPDVERWLPALWFDCGERTAAFRAAYTSAVQARLERVFYGALSEWCAAHGIALTGHPAESNDFATLRAFQLPGQDMVWRWVEPGAASALYGEHSCAPKCASSAAVLHGRARNASEVLGAYGWRLTLDEAKWLLDWHLVRGTNLFYPHAYFYSIRGRRAYESEPDLGIHNSWWPHFGLLGDYLRRMCWLLSDGHPIWPVAVLTDPHAAAWQAAAVLQPHQIDYGYIDSAALERATIADGHLCIAAQRFAAVICDPPLAELPPTLAAFRAAGGLVLQEWQLDTLVATLRERVPPDVDWPHAPDLRALHYRRAGYDIYLLVNEGEQPIAGELSLGTEGGLSCWDALDGCQRAWPSRNEAGRCYTTLRLERRQSLLLVVDPHGQSQPVAAPEPPPQAVLLDVLGPWRCSTEQQRPHTLQCPGDWAQQPGWEVFSGTVQYTCRFTVSAAQAEQARWLDVGRVGDIAEAWLNGEPLGVRAWAPYCWAIGGRCTAGQNELVLRITNSSANALEGLQLPSGLLGPVQIWR